MTSMTMTIDKTPETEVPAKATRRRFTKEYKLDVLEKADHCTAPGEVGKLLRQEGLYSSQLTAWRRERRKGALQALGKRRGPKVKRSADQVRIEKLERENKRLRKKLDHAEKILTVQKKLSEVLGIQLEESDYVPESD